MAKTTHDIQAEALTVQWTDTADEKQRTIFRLKALIAERRRELNTLLTRLSELEEPLL